jgi:hypothetical protein
MKMAKTVTLEKRTDQVQEVRLRYVARSKWSARFWWASIIQGMGAALVTGLILLPNIDPPLARVMTNGGSAGMWLALGYVLYVTIGVIAVAVTAIFYQNLEVALERPVRGYIRYLAGAHLILMNVGVAAVCGLLMYGGYVGGAAMLPTSTGGLQLAQAYTLLSELVAPATYALTVATVGFLCGGAVFLLSYLRR